jgi:CheY-like chemotaxis protein
MLAQKLSCVLLIDDHKPDNVLHTIIIEEANVAEKIVAIETGQKALDYLKSTEDGKHMQPDLIFLDINMPGINGWDFLGDYEQLDQAKQGGVVIVMLTTSLNPDDEAKARTYSVIKGFRNKPLTPEMLQELLEEHFADRF